MEYLNTGKKILKKITEQGEEAFFVGGVVRNILFNDYSIKDIDITTSAEPSLIIKLFAKSIKIGLKYGTVMVIEEGFKFEITTFRKELIYINRKPNVIFVKDKELDMKRRDLTINSIFMNYKLKIVDPYNYIDDFNNKLLKVIGNIELKFKEDPLRVLRVIRFQSIYNDFTLDNNLKNFMKNSNLNYYYNSISIERIRDELDKIIILDVNKRDLAFEKYNLYFNEITYFKHICLLKDVKIDRIAFYSHLYNYCNSNILKLSRRDLKDISIINKHINKNLTFIEIFKLNNRCIDAINQLNNLYNKNTITKTDLLIKDIKELSILSIEIIDLIGIANKKYIKSIQMYLISKILESKILNNNLKLKEEVIKYKKNYII